jgi:hypothetical protein
MTILTSSRWNAFHDCAFLDRFCVLLRHTPLSESLIYIYLHMTIITKLTTSLSILSLWDDSSWICSSQPCIIFSFFIMMMSWRYTWALTQSSSLRDTSHDQSSDHSLNSTMVFIFQSWGGLSIAYGQIFQLKLNANIYPYGLLLISKPHMVAPCSFNVPVRCITNTNDMCHICHKIVITNSSMPSIWHALRFAKNSVP